MRTRRLGDGGPVVSCLGMGCMGPSTLYGRRPAADEAITLIGAAIDRGVTLLDTTDVYGSFDNERLVGRAIVGRRAASGST